MSDDELAHLREENERLLGMNTSLQNELVGAIETQKAQGHELARLRRELNIETEASPNAQRVRLVLDAWANWHPKANTDIHGARARTVRAALRLGHTRPPLPCPVHDSNGNGKRKATECTVVDELLEALEGARLLPFVRYGKRIAAAVPGCARKDDIADILKDEATIEEMRGYARRARMSPPERLWAAYEATRDVSEGWFRRAVESLSRNGDGR